MTKALLYTYTAYAEGGMTGKTPLHYAVEFNNAPAAALMNAGADPDERD